MFSIGEFSRITGLPVKTLRFYQEKGLLVPAAVDDQSGYRYYDHANVEKARIIVALRALEFSLDEVGEILRGHDDDADILDHLRRQKAVLGDRVRRQQDIVATLKRIIRTETEARTAVRESAFQVEEKVVAPLLAAGLRFRGRYSDCGPAFAKLCKHLGRWMCGKPFCLYYDSEFREDDADVEACVPVRREVRIEGISVRPLPGGRVVSLLHRGPYEALGRAYAKVLPYVRERGLEVRLPTREVYLKGPGMIFRGNPRKYLTEIQLPLSTPEHPGGEP